MEEFNRILVVNYLAANSRDALSHGVDLAKKFGAELTVLRVGSNPVDMEAVNAPDLVWKSEEYKHYLTIRDQDKEELDKAIRHVTKGGFPVRVPGHRQGAGERDHQKLYTMRKST